jgi:hypothetical protein
VATKTCGQLPSEYITDDGDLDPTNGWCSITTLSGLTVSTLLYFNEHTTEYTSTMVNTTCGHVNVNDGLTLLRMATTIARNDHIDLAKVSLIAPSNGSSYMVSECSLQWCFQYDTDVQFVNGSISKRKTRLLAPNPVNSLPNTTDVLWNVTLAQGALPSLLKTSEPIPDFNISINHADTLGIREYLGSILNTSWATSSLGADSQPPILAQTLYVSQDATLMMGNLAASMSKNVRTSRNATSVYGQAMTNVTYVKVHWGWLLLLVVTISMSIIFLLIVIISSHLSDTFLWKSNSLALLFHGLDGWSSTELDATKVAIMTRMARTMDGQLRRDSDGLLKIVRS